MDWVRIGHELNAKDMNDTIVLFQSSFHSEPAILVKCFRDRRRVLISRSISMQVIMS